MVSILSHHHKKKKNLKTMGHSIQYCCNGITILYLYMTVFLSIISDVWVQKGTIIKLLYKYRCKMAYHFEIIYGIWVRSAFIPCMFFNKYLKIFVYNRVIYTIQFLYCVPAFWRGNFRKNRVLFLYYSISFTVVFFGEEVIKSQ